MKPCFVTHTDQESAENKSGLQVQRAWFRWHSPGAVTEAPLPALVRPLSDLLLRCCPVVSCVKIVDITVCFPRTAKQWQDSCHFVRVIKNVIKAVNYQRGTTNKELAL